MKNNKKIDDIDQLIALVEHAGRDARRQQQLSDMIGQMAQKESAKRLRSLRLWAVGLAAAASVAGLVITTVHFVNIQSGNTGLLTAEVQSKDASLSSPLDDGNLMLDTVSEIENLKSDVSVKPHSRRLRSGDTTTAKCRGLLSVPESFTMKPNDALIAEDVIAEDADSGFVDDYIDIDGTVLVEQADNAIDLTDAEEQQYDTTEATPSPDFTHSPVAVEPVAVTEAKTEKRRGLFRMRRTEPSMMHGTSLSLFAMNF